MTSTTASVSSADENSASPPGTFFPVITASQTFDEDDDDKKGDDDEDESESGETPDSSLDLPPRQPASLPATQPHPPLPPNGSSSRKTPAPRGSALRSYATATWTR